MTPEAQRIAIAEACGFTRDEVSDCWRKGGRTFFIEDPHHLQQLPDYLTDLNAMHEAEEIMTREQCYTFNAHLIDLRTPRMEVKCEAEKWSWHATAAQRAEAFLKTLNLWTTHPTKGPK